MVVPKQTPLQAEGPPLSKPPAAPPGGLPGVTALDGEPLHSFSIPYCAPSQRFAGSRGFETLQPHIIANTEHLWEPVKFNKL